jgi:penicillin amidase
VGGGDINTVCQAGSGPAELAANPYFIASLRMVGDVGNWNESRFVLPGGQSGNPLSPHYEDQLPLWRSGEGATIAWEPTDVAHAAGSRRSAEPAG